MSYSTVGVADRVVFALRLLIQPRFHDFGPQGLRLTAGNLRPYPLL